MREEVQQLEEVGNTIRILHMNIPGKRYPVQAALVVGTSLTSHYWLNILPLARNPCLRYYITEDDLESMVDHLHVYPDVLPSFLVFYHGYAVDWFPAPLPAPGCAHDPLQLVSSVQARIDRYR